MKQFVDIRYGLIFLGILQLVLSQYDFNDDSAHGMRVAANDQVAIYALNIGFVYWMLYPPFDSRLACTASFSTEDYFVYSLALVRDKDNATLNDTFTFVQVSENVTTNSDVVLSVITMQGFGRWRCSASFRHFSIWTGRHQEYMQVKVDPRNQFAYVFADSFVLSFDLTNYAIVEIMTNSSFKSFSRHIPRAVDLTNNWAIVAGLQVTGRYLYSTIYLMQLQPLRIIFVINDTSISDDSFYTILYNRANDMSVALNPRQDRALIGRPLYGMVSLLSVHATSANVSDWKIFVLSTIVWPTPNIGFGRSVAWLDETIVSITAFTVPDRYWSNSELWMFNINQPVEKPLFVFPNNQQTLSFKQPPLFLHTIYASGHLFVLTDKKIVIVYPARPAGHVSTWTENPFYFLFAYLVSKPCPAGSYKNESGFGPCAVCQPQTKNPADNRSETGVQCIACSTNSFCPLGSTDDVSLDNLSSYTQSFSYPDTPDINNYDDLLIRNMFTIHSTSRCIVLSPMFWVLLVIGLCIFVVFIMALLKSRQSDSASRYRTRAKRFLKQTDIISDGERWIGGLFSFAIVVLVGFSLGFAESYIDAYPIETASALRTACDDTIRNAMFDNAVQLPLPSVNGERWTIFDLLDKQPLTMTVDLINTRADCSSITVQQNRPNIKYLLLPIENCTVHYSSNAIRSITFAFPPHPSIVQLNITGTYFVGGIRFCLRGPGFINGTNTLSSLDVCQFYSTENQTLGLATSLTVTLVKTINQTKPLTFGDNARYDGRWTPMWNRASGLSDHLIYEQDGHYLRYAYERSIVTITLIEQPFFLQNNQQPIIRRAELAFHMLLFTSLVIELFGFAFLIVKLVLVPIVRLFLRYWHRSNQNESKENSCNKSQRSIFSDSQAISSDQRQSHSSLCLYCAGKRRKRRRQTQSQHFNHIDVSEQQQNDMHASSTPPYFIISRH